MHSFGAWDYDLKVAVLDPGTLATIHYGIEDLVGAHIRSIRGVLVVGTPKTKAYPVATEVGD